MNGNRVSSQQKGFWTIQQSCHFTVLSVASIARFFYFRQMNIYFSFVKNTKLCKTHGYTVLIRTK